MIKLYIESDMTAKKSPRVLSEKIMVWYVITDNQ